MATSKQSSKKRPGVRQLKHAVGSKESQDAIRLLKADHREVEALFKTFKRTESTAEKQAIAKKICDALKIHTRIEEEVFYPAFIAATGDAQIHNEALVEHQSAKQLIQEIEAGAAGDPLFEAKVSVLSEMIKHHVKEEERFNGMFTRARLSSMDLRALGVLLAARKQELARPTRKQRSKTAPDNPPAFMGAAALARSKAAKQPSRRAS